MKNILEKFKKKFNRENYVKKSEVIKYIPEFDYELYLNNLEHEDDMNTIPVLFWILLLKNHKLKNRFIKIMIDKFKCFTSRDYLKLANTFRERRNISYIIEINWGNIEVESLLEEEMNEKEKLTVIGLCTFHSNGYLREKALKKLIEMNDYDSFPFIAVRAHDWVYNVRCEAEEALENIISINNIRDIIFNIELIDKIKENIKSLRYYYGYEEWRISTLQYSEKRLEKIYLKIENILDKNQSEAFKYLKEAALGEDA